MINNQTMRTCHKSNCQGKCPIPDSYFFRNLFCRILFNPGEMIILCA